MLNLINPQNLVTGLIVAAATGVVGYLIKTFFILDGKVVLGSSPNVAGSYLSEYFDAPSEWVGETIEVKQFGRKIWGTISDNDSNYSVNFKGMVTPSRIIKYTFRPNDNDKNDYGVGLLRLDKYGEAATGLVLFLDEEKETPAAIQIKIRKKK
jgi:hypothetical protein